MKTNHLSDREFEVLNLIAFEYSTPEIAQRLYVSTNTVKTHRKNLFEKLGAKNIAGMVRIALEQGISLHPIAN